METVNNLVRVGDLIEMGLKLVDVQDRNDAYDIIGRLELALRMEPAVRLSEICGRVEDLAAIETAEDRDYVGKLYADVLAAEKQVTICTDEAVKFAHERHKAAKSWQNEYLEPLAGAKSTLKELIRRDQVAQAAAAEEARRAAQARADEIARAEQAEREAIAREALRIEREARLKAEAEARAAREAAAAEIFKREAEAAKARGAAAKARAAQELAEAQERARAEAARAAEASRQAAERERLAKLNAQEVKAVPVAAVVCEAPTVAAVAGVRVNKARYVGRVVDLAAVPEMYLMPRAPNMAMINAQVKALGLECRIPGVEIVLEAATVATKGR